MASSSVLDKRLKKNPALYSNIIFYMCIQSDLGNPCDFNPCTSQPVVADLGILYGGGGGEVIECWGVILAPSDLYKLYYTLYFQI